MSFVHELVASLWTTTLTLSYLLGATPNGRALNALILVVGFFALLVLSVTRVREARESADRLLAWAFFAASITYSAILGSRLAEDVLQVATHAGFRPYLSTFTLVGRACYLVALAVGTLRIESLWSGAWTRRALWIAGGILAAVLVADRLGRLASGPGGAPLSGAPPRLVHLVLHSSQILLVAVVLAMVAWSVRPVPIALLSAWGLLLLSELGLAGEHLANRMWALDASLASQLSFLLHVPALFIAMALRDRRQLFAAARRLRGQFASALAALLNLQEVSNSELRRHSQRHAELALKVAQRLGMSREEAEEVFWAALLHDIGKLSLDRDLLSVPRPLTAEEWGVMRQHPVLGARVIEGIPGLEHVVDFVRHHHERWDGSGYPDALRGDAIPLGSRIIAVVDAFDAMLSARPYRRPRTLMEGVREIRRQAARHFDPTVVSAFLGVLEDTGVPVLEEA